MREYAVGAGFLQVTRKRGPPTYISRQARYTEATIAGRPAVVERGFTSAIYLLDAGSSWQITGMGVSLEELTKVAEGIRRE
jgi:hypothetical protein